jgi:hypothetical protein
MKKLLLASLLFLLTLPATAQVQSQNFVHDFGDYDVYLRISALDGTNVSWVETARLEDHVCKQLHVQPVRLKGDTLRFSADTEWTVDALREGVVVTFPDGTEVNYERTTHDGIAHCLKPKKGI